MRSENPRGLPSGSTHFSDELVGVAVIKVAVTLWQLLLDGKILLFAEQVILL